MIKNLILIFLFCPLFFVHGQWCLKFSNSDSISCSSFNLVDGKISVIQTEFENPVLTRSFSSLESAKKFTEDRLSSPLLLRFRNSNQLLCSIEGIKDECLIVKTGFSDGFRIPLVDVSELIVSENLGISSPSTELDWRDTAKWQYLPANFAGNFKVMEGKILVKAPLISSIECPFKKVKISFSAFLNFDYGLSVQLFSNLKTNGLEAYSIHLLPYSVDALKFSGGSQKPLANKRLNEFPFESLFTRYEIAADCEKGTFEVVLNNKARFEFDDNDEKKISGNKLAFVCAADFAVICDLRISEWDSKPLEMVGNEPSRTFHSKDNDIVILRNNDSISGKLVQLTPSSISFKTDFATLQIPPERVASIKMRNSNNGPLSPERDSKKKFSHRVSLGDSCFFEVTPLSSDGKVMVADTSITDSPLKIDLLHVSALHKNEASSQEVKPQSLFDEMLKLEGVNFNIDNLDDDTAEKIEKELGELLEVFY